MRPLDLPGLGVKGAPHDMVCYCPTCSNKADENGDAPLLPGLKQTDDRSPLHMVCADGNAKATRFEKAGRAQARVEPELDVFFGAPNARFAASLSGPARAAALAAGPEDQSCGNNHLRCVKTSIVKGGTFSELGVVLFACPHGIPVCSSAIDCGVHGARCTAHARRGGHLISCQLTCTLQNVLACTSTCCPS